MEIVWTDGSASTTFTIKATTPEKTDDNTSDNTTGTTTDKTNETKTDIHKNGEIIHRLCCMYWYY